MKMFFTGLASLAMSLASQAPADEPRKQMLVSELLDGHEIYACSVGGEVWFLPFSIDEGGEIVGVSGYSGKQLIKMEDRAVVVGAHEVISFSKGDVQIASQDGWVANGKCRAVSGLIGRIKRAAEKN